MKALVLNLHDMILILGIAEALLVALALRLLPLPRKQAHNLLAILFIFLGGSLLCNLLFWSPGLHHVAIRNTIALPMLFSTCVLLQGPALYLYFQALSNNLKLKNTKHLLHFIPLLIVLTLIAFFHLDTEKFIPTPSHSTFAASLIWSAMKCAPLLYVFASVVFEIRVRRQSKDMLSSIPALENHLASIILAGFFIYWVWSASGHFISPHISLDLADTYGIINNYLGLVLINALLAFGFINARQNVVLPTRNKSTVLPDEKSQPIIERIEMAIHERKVYLESDINLERFAKEVSSNTKHVSQVINNHYRSNFFEFINYYRVEEAKRLLRSPEHAEKTILDIVYLSGFNSQSAFHRFFKRLVDKTPSQFRNNPEDDEPKTE